MARSSGTQRTTRPFVRKHSRSPGRVLGWVAVTIIVLVGLFYAGGGWYFSGQIHQRGFVVGAPDADEFDLTVDRVEPDSVVLSGDPGADFINTDGTFGLISAEVAGVVGGIVGASTDAGRSIVERDRTPGEPLPEAGSAARLDAFVWPGDPYTALGIAYREIEYPVEGGTAGAWWIPGDSDTWMILVHGKGAPKNETLRMLPIAAARGYNLMVIGYRNDPDAPADPSGEYRYGLTEWKDLTAAGRYAKERGATDLIVVGYSMGGGIVMSYLLQSPLRNQTAAAILDSPMLDFEATIDHQASQETIPLTPFGLPTSLVATAKWFAGWRFDVDWEAMDYVAQWRDLHTPTLIIQGTGDRTIPLEPAHELATTRPDVVTLITPPGVDHVLAWNSDPDGYAAAVNAFLDTLGL